MRPSFPLPADRRYCQPFALEFRTEPNGFVGVFASAGLDTLTAPQLEQPVWLSSATCFALDMLSADANGLATGSWSVPAGTYFAGERLWLQGFSGPLPMQTSPVVGGIVR